LSRDFSVSPPASRRCFFPWREAVSRREATQAASQLLEFFGITPQYHDKLPGDIPYGVQRLLSVALAYGTGAKALCCSDEPAAGLAAAI